ERAFARFKLEEIARNAEGAAERSRPGDGAQRLEHALLRAPLTERRFSCPHLRSALARIYLHGELDAATDELEPLHAVPDAGLYASHRSAEALLGCTLVQASELRRHRQVSARRRGRRGGGL